MRLGRKSPPTIVGPVEPTSRRNPHGRSRTRTGAGSELRPAGRLRALMAGPKFPTCFSREAIVGPVEPTSRRNPHGRSRTRTWDLFLIRGLLRTCSNRRIWRVFTGDGAPRAMSRIVAVCGRFRGVWDGRSGCRPIERQTIVELVALDSGEGRSESSRKPERVEEALNGVHRVGAQLRLGCLGVDLDRLLGV